MLRMIIADDEALVREGIRSIIPWQEYDIEIIAEAAEGREAYELCRLNKPDILFTDIRMPFMDGLEVARRLKKDNIEVKVIIFSSLQDFSYAKSAVDVSAEGYILKPLEVKELRDVVKKVTNKISLEKNNKERLQKLREQLKENIAAASEKFLSSLLLGSFSSAEEIEEKLEYFSNPFNSKNQLIVAAAAIDDYNIIKETYIEKDKQLLNFAITNVMDEIIRAHTKGISFCMSENQFITIFNWDEKDDNTLNDIFESVISELNKLLSISVSVGVSRTVSNIMDIPRAYKDGLNALQYRFYTGKGSVISTADINENNNEVEHLDFYDTETKLTNAIKVGDISETATLITEAFHKLKNSNNYKMEYVQSICSEIILICSRVVFGAGDDGDGILSDRIKVLDRVQNIENIFALEEYMIGLLKKMAQYFSKKHKSKNDKVVSDIKAIICKTYMTDISVNKIAQMVYLSPNYISLIFKKETGVTVTDYLTGIRIDRAKELLKDTELLIQQVSEMVGYEDASYFSKVFKKVTGIHPLRYRSFISG